MPTGKKDTKTKKDRKTGKRAPAKSKKTGKIGLLPEIDETGFSVVGIGASAGGLEAFEQFFTHMPGDSGMAFVLVPHLDPTHVSLMPDLLKKYAKTEVVTIEDGMKVQPNFAYVIPPNKDLAILKGKLQLIEPIKVRGKRLPIDYFFRSLALDQRGRAIGIILSGTGTDGTLGLKAIKEELGMVMVQDPESAKYNGMPRSAIQTVQVDYILPVEEMPEHLIKYAKYAVQRIEPAGVPVEGNIQDALPKIFILLRAHTGHDFSLYKKNTLCRRIERRMNVHHIDQGSHYVRYLQENTRELEILFKELLIGVTSFFRDAEAFEALKDVLFKELANKPDDSALRVWVPGCANGEEAYSIAIIIRECMDSLKRHFAVQVFGTDIDADAIDTARAGTYPSNISADVNPERLDRFFLREENAYRVRKEIREMLVFAPQSIIKDPPFTKLDLLCCRNLMIYLDSELQKKMLPLFHYSLKVGGILFLGSSETIGGFVELFGTVEKRWKIFKRKSSVYAAHRFIEFPILDKKDEDAGLLDQKGDHKKMELDFSRFVEKNLLQRYAPPCALINQEGKILYLHGHTGKYLEPAPGKPRWKITDMARGGLKLQLPFAIREVISQKKEVTYEGLRVNEDDGSQFLNLTVKPVIEPEEMRGLIMVIFEGIFPSRKLKSDPKKSKAKNIDKHVEALEQELQHTKENLQSTIEELETSNEELKSANEELQSTNEELQSTNEELETSKEELQSLNEELVTVNNELEDRIYELSKSNDDMHNLLEGTEIATIFLDRELCIKRYNEHSTKMLNLIQADVGRPMSHISTNLQYENLVEDAKEVLRTLVPKEIEVRSNDGYWYWMRIIPYRTIDNVIDGVVITFSDIHEQKTAIEKVKELQIYAENILDTVREPLVVLDKDLRVISINRSFLKTFQVKFEETERRHIYDLGDGQWNIPRLRELLENIVSHDSKFDDFEVDHNFPEIGHKRMLLNARKIVGSVERDDLVLLAIEDITGR